MSEIHTPQSTQSRKNGMIENEIKFRIYLTCVIQVISVTGAVTSPHRRVNGNKHPLIEWEPFFAIYSSELGLNRMLQ